MKNLMLGNAAVARGAYEANVRVVSAYPGTPSTEITEEIAKYDAVYAEWAPNEKVALEVAVGSSVAGGRALACMKHVGLNVAADPLFTVSYTGVNGGLVIAVADDPGMHSSQNEQDSRFYARSSFLPMLEPSSSEEARLFTRRAFEVSEQFDVPVLLRLTTRVAHSQGFVSVDEPQSVPVKEYKKNSAKYVMMPNLARARHIEVEKRNALLKQFAEATDFNVEETGTSGLGVVCSGAVYSYVKEVLPDASVFKLGLVYPLPIERIRTFSKKVERLIVIEELEPFFENQLKANGITCEGKNLFSVLGEILPADIRKVFDPSEKPAQAVPALPARPPVLCAGCPHRGVFYILNKLKVIVTGDIGCYTLGAVPPLAAVDTVLCMGASVGMNHGMCKARGEEFTRNSVAVIGDSTFIHSGITGLINAVYNRSNVTLLILDNSTTGMTGHQNHPATGVTLKGETTQLLDLELLVRAVGVKNVRIVDSFDLEDLESAVREETAKNEVSVIFCKRPCILLKKDFKVPVKISGCKNCKMCVKLGCPALVNGADGVTVDPALCVGCGLCEKVCKFHAISSSEVK